MAELMSSKIKIKAEGLPDNAPTIEIHGDNITINVNNADGDRDQDVRIKRLKETAGSQSDLIMLLYAKIDVARLEIAERDRNIATLNSTREELLCGLRDRFDRLKGELHTANAEIDALRAGRKTI